jgi:hypothetical protein
MFRIVALTAVFSTSAALAAISPVLNGSGARAYFGSQGTAYMDADPVTVFTPPANVGPYPAGSPLPNVPTPPVSVMYPATSGYNFTAGGGYTFNFNDNFGGTTQFTAATTTIDHIFNPAGTLTSDVSIDFPIWRFWQGPNAPLYAYEQITFVSQYLVTSPLGASTPAIPLFFNGSVSGLGTPFVQFDASITYTWIPTNSAGIQNGAPTTLGTLSYAWQMIGAGPFAGSATSTGALAATPTSFGVLELTGYAYVTGDPFDITITSVPEPSSISLIALAAGSLLRRRRLGYC